MGQISKLNTQELRKTVHTLQASNFRFFFYIFHIQFPSSLVDRDSSGLALSPAFATPAGY